MPRVARVATCHQRFGSFPWPGLQRLGGLPFATDCRAKIGNRKGKIGDKRFVAAILAIFGLSRRIAQPTLDPVERKVVEHRSVVQEV